jgi:hypothetical protein
MKNMKGKVEIVHVSMKASNSCKSEDTVVLTCTYYGVTSRFDVNKIVEHEDTHAKACDHHE